MKRELTHGSLFNGIEGFGLGTAGKGAGIKGSRSGLWGQMHRIIGEVKPNYVIIENSPLLRKRGFEYVSHGLSEIGYDAQYLFECIKCFDQ